MPQSMLGETRPDLFNACEAPGTRMPWYGAIIAIYDHNTAAVVTSPKAISYSREGIATYQLNHRAQLHLTGSAQLQW
jgi:hypothetical protein